MKLTTGFPQRAVFQRSIYPAEITLQPRRKHLPMTWLILYGFAALIVISVPFGLVLGANLYFQESGRVLPKMQIGAASVGGMTPNQAAIEVQRVWNLEKSLLLTDGVRSWAVSPNEIGIEVDAVKSAQNAAAYGHGQGLTTGLSYFTKCLRNGCQVDPVVEFKPEQTRLALESLAAQVSIQPVNAAIHLNGARVDITSGVQGYQLDVQATLAGWSVDLYDLFLSGKLPLVMAPVQPEVADLSAWKVQIEAMLNDPKALRGYDPVSNEWLEWKPTPEQVASWLKVDQQNGQPQLSIASNQVSAWLAQIDQSLRPERRIDIEAEAAAYLHAVEANQNVTLIVKHQPTSYTVVSGDTLIKIAWKVGMPYWKILAANPGIDQNALSSGQELQIPSKDELLPLPVVVNKRIVISISQQRMWTYQDGQQLNEYVISTGIDRSPTQPGVFQVRTHELDAYAELWDLHMPHFLGIYEAWPGFFNGIHGLPTLANGQRLWENVLGRPASYGCIILNLPAADEVYNWAEEGVVVEIQS